jgi:hypothetical protein
MTNESIFLITEIWLSQSKFEEFKSYRIRLLELIEKYKPEYVYHGHPFSWALETDDGAVPTGIEVLRFETEEVAKQALNAIKESGLLNERNKILEKSRCYLSKYEMTSWKSV